MEEHSAMTPSPSRELTQPHALTMSSSDHPARSAAEVLLRRQASMISATRSGSLMAASKHSTRLACIVFG
eukprot:1149475-Pelagomonas_calceolata.AAC.8